MILNYRAIFKLFGNILIILALCMLPALVLSFLYKEMDCTKAFVATMVPMLIVGTILTLKIEVLSTHLKIRDGYMVVALSWLTTSVLGAIPFMFSGAIPNFADAFFETASGFSTTGATILPDVEILPKSLLFWRSFTHWIGGMGILVFAIVLLPALGISGQSIAKAETTGPTVGKLAPKLSDSLKILYKFYIGMTLMEILLLLLGDMSLFDAFIHTFGSVSSGGFSNYNASTGYFNSLYIDIVITLFMMLSGINFTLFYYLSIGRWHEVFHDRELRLYLFILLSSSALIALNLWFTRIYESPGEALRYASFQSVSIMTTTGYMNDNFDLWPTFSKMLLFILMFIGGSSSSTSGGIKVIRILILLKLVKRSMARRLHPRAVIAMKFDGKPVSTDTISAVTNFVFLYIAIFSLGTILLSLENHDLLTTASAVAACLGNIGPGFNMVGPTLNYSIFSDLGTFFLGMMMLVGRLELFTIILLFSKQFWNPDK